MLVQLEPTKEHKLEEMEQSAYCAQIYAQLAL